MVCSFVIETNFLLLILYSSRKLTQIYMQLKKLMTEYFYQLVIKLLVAVLPEDCLNDGNNSLQYHQSRFNSCRLKLYFFINFYFVQLYYTHVHKQNIINNFIIIFLIFLLPFVLRPGNHGYQKLLAIYCMI